MLGSLISAPVPSLDPSQKTSSYLQLDAERVTQTAGQRAARVRERFPDSGLSGVAKSIHRICGETNGRLDRLQAPYWPLRALFYALLLALIALISSATLATLVRPA